MMHPFIECPNPQRICDRPTQIEQCSNGFFVDRPWADGEMFWLTMKPVGTDSRRDDWAQPRVPRNKVPGTPTDCQGFVLYRG